MGEYSRSRSFLFVKNMLLVWDWHRSRSSVVAHEIVTFFITLPIERLYRKYISLLRSRYLGHHEVLHSREALRDQSNNDRRRQWQGREVGLYLCTQWCPVSPACQGVTFEGILCGSPMSSDIVIFKSFGAEDAFRAKARTASKKFKNK